MHRTRTIVVRLTVAILAATECLGQTFTTDPCDPMEYKQLNEPHRSTGFLTVAPEVPLCDDRLRRGWYRFTSQAGGEIPTSCQETNRCGTTQPIWLDGLNPTVDDGISMRKICVNMNTSDPQARRCCEYSEDIFVRNCNGYFVYYLYPTVDCDMAYCAGNIPPCPVGKWSNTSFPPCNDPFPVLETPPVVTGPDTLTNTSIGFQCEFVYDQDHPDQRFEVTWTFNGVSDSTVAPQLLSATERVAWLDIGLVTKHINTNVACQIRSYYLNREAHKSSPLTSNGTFFGLQIPPVLSGPILSDNTSFTFECEVVYDVNLTQDFEVIWTFDGQQDPALTPQIITGRTRTAILDGSALKGHMNTKVGCQARLTYPESDFKTTFLNSNVYFAGIQITPNPLEMSEIDFEKYVTVTSTIPIVCDLGQDCCLTLRLNVNETSAVSLLNACEHKICSSDWDSLQKTASVKIGVVPTRNILVGDNKGVYLTFKVIVPSNFSTNFNVFHDYKPSQLQISVKDETSFQCSLTGDPHIFGFDFKFMYHLYKGGDFIAVVIQERDFMIQVRTVPCGGGSVACICGIVVKEGNDVIKVNKCNNPISGQPTIDIAYKLNPGTIVQRSTDGYRYGIYLRSGSEVKIDAGGTNVYISLPAFDKGLGRGLCGTNDGIQDNDFTHPDGKVSPACNEQCIPDAFLESWRVTHNASLFEVVPDPENSTDQGQGSTTQYCSCLEKPEGDLTVSCSAREHVQIANTACPGCPVITDGLVPSYIVGVGWVRPGTNKPETPFVHPDVAIVDPNKQWPNDQGITEAQARDICTEAMRRSQLYLQCQSITQITSSVITNCLADILFGDTTEFLDDVTSSFTTQCQLTLAQNPDNYVVNKSGDPVMKPELLDNICPVECLKHGQCGDKGWCQCQDGWEGETCLIEIGKGPQLVEIKGGAVCDNTQRACDIINIQVYNLNFLDQLLYRVQVVDEQGITVGTPVITTAAFLTPDTITCTLPLLVHSTQRYKISASKNGTIFGNELTFRVFDGTCLDCDAAGCKEKSTSCHINNVCYKNGVADPNDGNRTCDITKSTTKWSTKRSEEDRYPLLVTPPTFSGPDLHIHGSTGFQCEVVYDRDDPEQVFEVVWVFNGQSDPSILPELLFRHERITTLNITSIKGHVDKYVGCTVRSYYIAYENSKSPFLASNKTYFGIQTAPVLTGPILSDNKTFTFQCQVVYNVNDSSQEIEVVWTFNGQQDAVLSPQVITGSNRVVVLDGKFLKGHLGSQVGCQARLTYPESDVKTGFISSNVYFAGIKITPNPLEMSEIDFEKYVTVTSTIPIVCDLEQDCCLTLRLNVNETSAVSLMNTCEHKICSSDWDPIRNTASVKIGVVPTRNILVGDNKGVYLSLQVIVPSNFSTESNVFEDHKPNQLQISVKDETAFQCSLTGDPHIFGFDFKFMYHLYKSGDFIAVVIQERDFMIQVRTVPCGGGSVACICGIVVKEGNDVIKVNKCNNPISGQPTIDIAYKLNPGTIVQRSADGYRYGIYLQSGSEVKIDAGGTNVYISLPAFDKGLGRGLCGTNDGIQDNDFTHPDGKVSPACDQQCIPDAFLESWRVTHNASLFEVVPDPENSTDSDERSTTQYCSCLERSEGNLTVSCSAREHVQMANTACPGCPVITDGLIPAYVTGVGWVRPGTNTPETPFVHPDVKVVDPNKQWPNDQGITEAQARDICTEAMRRSQLYPQCQSITQITSSVITNCLADILFGDTTEFLDDVTSSFTTQCQLTLAQNPDNYVINKSGDPVMKPELLDNICPVECLKHGQCGDKGRCQCQDGWDGETCLIEIGKGPQLVEIKGGAVCDNTQRACDIISIQVSNINFLDQLLYMVQAVDEQGNIVGTPVITTAVFFTPDTITCALPVPVHSTQRYRISASKNGTVFGNELTFRVFDGTCLNCDAAGCKEKSTSCHIDNVCYKNGVADPNDGNRTCDITKSTIKWSTRRSQEDPYPLLVTPPTFSGPDLHINGSTGFQCEVVYDRDDPEQVFEVVWVFNGQSDPSIPPELLFRHERITTLNITSIKGHVDKYVGCRVRSYYSGHELNKSPFLASNTIYIGMQTPPVLTGPILPDNKTFTFQCQVVYNVNDSSQEIEVVWTFNGQQDTALPPQVITGSNRVVVLDGQFLKGHLGSKVSCQARFTFTGSDVQTRFIQSNTYYAGIQISPDPLVMSEIDFEKNITVTSTIPIICDDKDIDCCLIFKMNINETAAVSFLNSCDHKMCTSDWDQFLKTASIQVAVVPTRNIYVESNTNLILAFDVIMSTGSGAYRDIYQNYRPSHLQISVKNDAAFKCSLTGDPHIYGFGLGQVYSLYDSGDYIATVVKERDFMVQIRAVPCGAGAVTCVCGIVVRERNDIIKINKCDSGLASVAIAYELSSGAIIQRSSDGNRFGIYLRSGSEVRIERGGTNVYISLPAFDKGLTRGLCGTSDSIPGNYFLHPDGKKDSSCSQKCNPNAFFQAWRVHGSASLFEIVPDPVNTTDPVYGFTSQYCSCLDRPNGNSSVLCSARQHLQRINTACHNCPVITDLLVPSYTVGIGWVRPGSSKPEPPFVHPDVKPADPNKQWPSDQGYTEAQARDLCTQTTQKSQLYPQCQRFDQLVNTSISDCLADILFGGTTQFLDDITSAFTSQCQLILAQNPDNYDINAEGDPVIKPELLDNVCPIECSKHGQCRDKGRCQCQDGWEGETCLIETGKGPQLVEIKGGSRCDIAQRKCDSIHLDIMNIDSSDRLWCGAQEVDEQGGHVGSVVMTTAVFLSPTTIICTVPALAQSLKNYVISATKDGVIFGNELAFIPYDGTCLECSNRGCTQKSSACHISNACYDNGKTSQNDENRICDVTKNTSDWTLKNAGQITTEAPVPVYPTRPPKDQTLRPCHFCVGG